jgi:hypothetical protein
LEIKEDLSRYPREAEMQEMIITRQGEPAGVLIGFETEERTDSTAVPNMTGIERARNSLGAGGGIRLEEFETE